MYVYSSLSFSGIEATKQKTPPWSSFLHSWEYPSDITLEMEGSEVGFQNRNNYLKIKTEFL